MPHLWGRDYSRAELMQRIGDISQVGGGRAYRIDGGSGDGLPTVEVNTGSGFRFRVIPGRGLDISGAWYKGVPLAYRTASGEVQGSRHEPEAFGWMRTSVLGLLTTCGLDNAGDPGTEDGRDFGLHGYLSHMQADNVHVDGEWDGDEYRIWVQGRVRQAVIYGENLELKRRISTQLGASSLDIHDEITNLGHRPEPMMVLYHINPGYPVLDAGSQLHMRSRSRRPHYESSLPGEPEWDSYRGPTKGWDLQVFVHDVEPEPDGTVRSALVNRGFGDGLGLTITHNKTQLPFVNQWKQTGLGEYVTAIEPANCSVTGRVQNREDGTLQILQPSETATFDVSIGVLDGRAEIDDIVALIGK